MVLTKRPLTNALSMLVIVVLIFGVTAFSTTSTNTLVKPTPSVTSTAGLAASVTSTTGLAASVTSTAGPASSGPSTSSYVPSSPSTAGPASSGTSTAGPASSGPSTSSYVPSGPSRAGPASSGTSTAGPVASGPSTSSYVSSGPSTAGPASSGTSTAGPVASGPSTSSYVASGPSTAGPVSSGTSTAGPASSGTSTSSYVPSSPSTAGLASSGTSTAGPVASGPSTSSYVPSGPSTAGPASSGTSTSSYVPSGPSTSSYVPSSPSTAGPASSGTSTAGPVASGPSTSSYVPSGPSTAGPASSGTSTSSYVPSGPSTSSYVPSGPSTAGPASSGTSTAGPASSGTSTAGPVASGPSTSSYVPSGPSTAGPASSGTSTAGHASSGPSTSSYVPSGPSTAGPASSGPSRAGHASSGPSTAGPTSSGPSTSSPVASGPSTSSPVASGPSTASPVASGPSTASPVASGPSTASPVASGPSTSSPVGSSTMPKIVPSPSPTSKVLTVTSSHVSPSSIMMTTRPMKTPAITPTPTTTRKEPVVSTSSVIPKTSNKTFKYEISFTVTDINESRVSEEDFLILHLLITKCNAEYTEKNSIQFITFQYYLQNEICASIYKSSSEECSVTVKKLQCGSLVAESVVELKDNSTKLIEDKVNKEGSLGGLVVDKTSFNSTYTEANIPKPSGKPPQAEPEVYVVVTMIYSWREFCVVETHFKERIAERSYDLKGNQLTPNNIYIINREHCRDKRFDGKEEEIEVRFVVIAEKQNEATIQVGKDLIELVDSRLTRKLGNLFEDKIVKVEIDGVKAPQSPGRSDTDTIWLAVGISLGIILLLILLYFCCCRQSEKESDAERGTTNLFLMDEMDSPNKETSVLVNEGFDGQDETHTPLAERISTFKDNSENGNKPVTKSSSDDVSASVPGDSDSMDAPLGEGEDTDDELGMTVADVAIEPESEEDKKSATPPGTLPIIPPDPTHMAIKDLPMFHDERRKENEQDKEYENLSQSMTSPNTFPSNTQERNRSAALVPNPETRVKLAGENDYINANFVKDHNGKNNFIATQHPLSNTMRDFWTMVWEQDVSVVVMVNEKEKDLENYHNYWLDHKNSLTIYGHMQVKTDNMEALPGFCITTFVLQNSQESNVTKTVTHYRFTNWTENGTPNVKEFAGFIKSVEKARLENLQQPIVVHCSEGQGYTGVAIATDIGLRVYNESDKKAIINVFDCVEKMRKDRNGIVCSKDMYNFIFKVLSTLAESSNDSKL